MENPITASYLVYSDNMVVTSSKAILPNDNLKAETISLEKIIPGREYIVNDNAGNTYLCAIEEINPGQPLRLHSFNPAFNDVFIKRDDINSIAIVYRLDRPTISMETLAELFDEEPAPLINDHDFKIIDTFLDRLTVTQSETGVPVFKSTQLNPRQMAAEAKGSETSIEKKLQILEAFKKGYSVMKRFNCPADRILFVDTGKNIDVFLD